MITQAQADQFGKDWIEAWNSHDLDRILSHYSEDFVMSSPHIAAIAGEPSGVLKGKRAVGDYWKQALSRIPDLHFELLATFAGADSVAIHYNGARGPAIEVLFFDASGLVDRAAAHYLPKEGAPSISRSPAQSGSSNSFLRECRGKPSGPVLQNRIPPPGRFALDEARFQISFVRVNSSRYRE